jgi:hypothetical protein
MLELVALPQTGQSRGSRGSLVLSIVQPFGEARRLAINLGNSANYCKKTPRELFRTRVVYSSLSSTSKFGSPQSRVSMDALLMPDRQRYEQKLIIFSLYSITRHSLDAAGRPVSERIERSSAVKILQRIFSINVFSPRADFLSIFRRKAAPE